MLLMLKDTPVMQIDIDRGVYDVFDSEHIPFQLKDRFRDVPEITGTNPKYEATQAAIALAHNNEKVIDWLASRVLPLSRANAKKIYQLFGFEQLQDSYSKARIAVVCRAASLQDNYWVKLENDNITWDEIDLRKCKLSEVVAQVSLHGSSLTLNGKDDEIRTPELNGQGAYAKAWIREPDGLYLHKRSADDNNLESQIEVCVSNILDKCNVSHVKYLESINNNKYTCKCRCMTTEKLSMLPGMDFISLCNIKGMSPDKEFMTIDKDNIMKMWIVDYLISNRDRHGMNWGFYYDSDNMEIICCHPLYDHNNSFDTALMENDNAEYLFNRSYTMKDAAKYAMKHVDFHFTDCITKDDFMTEAQYKSFSRRASELEIEIDRNNSLDNIANTVNKLCLEYRKLEMDNNSQTSSDINIRLENANSSNKLILDIKNELEKASQMGFNAQYYIFELILNSAPELYQDIHDKELNIFMDKDFIL